MVHEKIVNLGLRGLSAVPCHITGELTRTGDKLRFVPGLNTATLAYIN
jgi:hypothetical protein